MSNLYEHYKTELHPKLQKDLAISNPMEVPKITKVTLNMGVGAAATDKKLLDGAVADMQLIAGQKPVVTLARKSIAGFKPEEIKKYRLGRIKNKEIEKNKFLYFIVFINYPP